MGLLRAELVEISQYVQQMGHPSVCMLGNQEIYADSDDMESLLTAYGINYNKDFFVQEKGVNKMDSRSFFKAIGAGEVCALDYSDYEGADIIFDLNNTEIPDELKKRFDLIIDGGVLEHIFNVGTALNNITSMLRAGGYVYHMVPLAGLVNHGFFSISPTLFQDFYTPDRFKIECFRMQYKPERGFYKFVFYSMDCRLFKNADGFNQYIQRYWDRGGEILLQCIVKKKNNADFEESARTPLQGLYQQLYGEQL